MAPYCILCEHSIHCSMKVHRASKCSFGQMNCKCFDKQRCVSCRRAKERRAKERRAWEKHVKQLQKIENKERAAKTKAFAGMKQFAEQGRKNKKSCLGSVLGCLKKLTVTDTSINSKINALSNCFKQVL